MFLDAAKKVREQGGVGELCLVVGNHIQPIDGEGDLAVGAAIRYGQQEHLGCGRELPGVEKDRLAPTLRQVQLGIKSQDATHCAAFVGFEDAFSLEGGFLGRDVLNLNEARRAIDIFKTDKRCWRLAGF